LIEDEEPMKKCTKCGQWKPISEFSKSKTHRDGLYSWCKECDKEKGKERWENCKINTENYKRKKIAKTLSLHRKRGYDVIVTIDECMEMDNDYCFYCGCKLEWEYGTGFTSYSPTIDRLNNGNTLTKSNTVFACNSCNAGKNSGTVEEYIERCKRVVANENNILRK